MVIYIFYLSELSSYHEHGSFVQFQFGSQDNKPSCKEVQSVVANQMTVGWTGRVDRSCGLHFQRLDTFQ